MLRPMSALGWEDVIRRVLEEYRRREDKVMVAAKSGHYRHGVDKLLRLYELPPTLRDTDGKTILHHAVSAKDDKGYPKWTLESLRSLLKNHDCFVNAQDYEGRTCLHALAEAATSGHSLRRDGRLAEGPEIWVDMARILIEFGCRSFHDCSKQLPHEIAKQNGNVQLSNYIQQEYKNWVNVNIEDSNSSKELVADAQENDEKLYSLSTVNILPMDAKRDPLTEAVKRGSLEAALVLLCAGAPLCGLPLECITPLEAAQGRCDLPALLPAILRKEYVNKLQYEASCIAGSNTQQVELRENIEELAMDIEQIGPKATWRFARECERKSVRSKKARELLCTAAGLGLSLSCQMFGLEDVHLHPMPREDTPVKSALKSNRENVLYILFRDLNMSISVGSDDWLPSTFYNEALKCETKKFKQYCKRMKLLVGEEPDSLLLELSNALEGKLKCNISKDMMLCISGYGLVLLLNKFLEYTDINRVIDDISGFTMLHVSALYGRLDMVAYLLFNGANIEAQSKDGFTAAHVAAMKGQRECVAYLHAYQSRGHNEATQDTSIMPLSAEQLAEGYEALVKNFTPLLLPEEYGLDVLSEPQEGNKVKLILQKKMKQLNISDNDSFRSYIADWRAKARDENVIEQEVKGLLQEMGEKPGSKFRGKLVQKDPKSPMGNYFVDECLQMFWEVESETYGDFQVIHNNEDICSIHLKYDNPTKNSAANRFREHFYDEVKETLSTYTFKTSTIWRSYPRIALEKLGVSINLVWYDNGITWQVKVLIVPVLKTEYPEDTDVLPPLVTDCLQEKASVYITKTEENGKWTYVMTQLEDMISSRLSDEKQLVLSACKFLNNVLEPCWWFPRLQSKRQGRVWHSYAISIRDVPDQRQTLTLFLKEVTQTEEKDWEPSKFLERVIGIYSRSKCNGDSNGPQTMESIRIFLDPKHGCFKPSSHMSAIVDALGSLQMEVH